jgi:TruD family tRNA pseudouridine synthase
VESLCPALSTTVLDGLIFAGPRPNLAPLLELLAVHEVHALLNFSFARPANGTPELLELGALDRDSRTKLHQHLRTTIKQVQADTVSRKRDADGAVVDESRMVVRWRALRTKETARSARNGKFYLHFVLQKRGVETHAAVKEIARALNVSPSSLSFAGTKDRQAVTVQRMSIAQADARALMRVAPHLEAKGLRVGSLSYARSQIQLGELSGNHFTVVLRDVRLACQYAESAMSGSEASHGHAETEQLFRSSVASVVSDGFVNYFGMQRFGVCGHLIGRCLLRKDYDGAADLIIGSGQASEPTEVAAVRTHWSQSRNVRSTLAMASKVAYSQRRLGDETDLLRGHLREGSFKAAFEALTFQKRSMWVAAYVSALWNQLVSLRLELEPCCALEGDLLVDPEPEPRPDAHRDGDSGADVGSPGADVGREACLESADGSTRRGSGPNAMQLALGGEALARVGVAVPSRTATYVQPLLQSALEAQLRADGVDQSSLPSKVAIRRVVARARDVSVEILERPRPQDSNGIDFRLTFRLQSSTYATMALRQILRCESTELEERRGE